MTLHEKHIQLIEVVNTSKTHAHHADARLALEYWRKGVEAAGRKLDLDLCECDMHYIRQGIDRPMCCGVWLDWSEANAQTEPRPMNNSTSTRKLEASAPVPCSDLWQSFAARFRDEYGFEPNPRDKSVQGFFSWYGWGHAAHAMGWGIQKGPHPLTDCPECGEFRGHGHECRQNE